MTTSTYRPHPIHRLFAWINSLAAPLWLLLALIFLLVGLSQHLVAWQAGTLVPGEFNLYLGVSAIWLVGVVFLLDWMESRQRAVFEEFSSLLELPAEKLAAERFAFTHIPFGAGWFFLAGGLVVGLIVANSQRAGLPAINFQVPVLMYSLMVLPISLIVLVLYQIDRQMLQMNRLFKIARVDIHNLTPIYAFPHYIATVGILVFLIDYVIQIILAPTIFQSWLVVSQTLFWVVTILVIFYLPLRGIHRRIVSEKERRVREVNERIESLFAKIRSNYEKGKSGAGELNQVLTAFKAEREELLAIPTWPWKAGTLTGLLTALLLPLALSVLQVVVARLLGLS